MGPICILRVQFHPLHNSAKVYPNDTCSPSRTNKTRWARHASHVDCGHGSGMKELYVCTSVRFPFFLSFCLSIRPSLSPSVHPSFFPSLTSPSSLAPFSLIYIFLVSFSGNHVIGLLSMCSNVHTIAYMQLLDLFYCQIFCQFCTWNIWFQISTYLKDFSWKINGPKLAKLCGNFFFIKHWPDFYDKFY